MVRPGKSKRDSVRKLKRYGESMERPATFVESSSSSKSKGNKKGKEKAEVKERIVTEMETIEAWVMEETVINVETKKVITVLTERSRKCGPLRGITKV
ncbi:hypothetical protein A4A49_41044 [Nicotiana attenuata]|uniref:Uncharacterized protein n=1 Tax=Nicotiana attenuata TaxID=49451 RepID=A0A314KGR9_NICAT|nr:hypothetical protein A4A49_41044 [Nicotiana attenuata]